MMSSLWITHHLPFTLLRDIHHPFEKEVVAIGQYTNYSSCGGPSVFSTFFRSNSCVSVHVDEKEEDMKTHVDECDLVRELFMG